MAQVLLGRQTGPNGFERPVVVKRILPHLVRRQSFVDMFLDEARTIASIRHPNVVNIHDFRHQDGELFMVMEYLEGETTASLRRRLQARGERMPDALWCYIFAETCAGLHAAHQATNEMGLPLNLVHRDVSPPNILVTYDGAVKLIDFGIAKSDHRSSHTDAGHIKGKYAYMSPEQARGRPLDARSDIFSLGVVMFEMTTGRRLFKRETELDTVQAVCNEPIPDPKSYFPDYSPDLGRICMRALARDPAERYQSALELRRDLLALVRADDTLPLPEELIGLFMQDIFEDRIDLKRGLLHRVRHGEKFDTFSSPTDSMIGVSTLMTGALPEAASKDRKDEHEALPSAVRPILPPPESNSPPRAWNSTTLIYIGFAVIIGLLLAVAAQPREETVAAPPPPPPAAPPPPPVVVLNERVTLEFSSDPLGATVNIGGTAVGETPLELAWDRSEDAIELTFERDGYQPWTAEVTPSRDVFVKGHLTPLPRRRRRRPKRIRRESSRTEGSTVSAGRPSAREAELGAVSSTAPAARRSRPAARPPASPNRAPSATTDRAPSAPDRAPSATDRAPSAPGGPEGSTRTSSSPPQDSAPSAEPRRRKPPAARPPPSDVAAETRRRPSPPEPPSAGQTTTPEPPASDPAVPPPA